MKLFLVTCLMMIVSIVFAYILTLCNSYNFLSYELGIILGGFTAILGLSVKDSMINKLKIREKVIKFQGGLLWKLKSF